MKKGLTINIITIMLVCALNAFLVLTILTNHNNHSTKFGTTSFEGTGLGLFISKSIVEAHGGRMWARNNVNGEKGATFSFSLPVLSSSAPATISAPSKY